MHYIGKKIFPAILALLLMASATTLAGAHCQVPCGIYDDHMRVHMMEEDMVSIEKAMKSIMALQQESPVNYNQLVRWVNTKEEHAQKIQDLVSEYFLAQRIKPNQPQYTKRLELLHQLITGAMKCKQTLSVKYVKEMRKALKEFEAIYFAKE